MENVKFVREGREIHEEKQHDIRACSRPSRINTFKPVPTKKGLAAFSCCFGVAYAASLALT
jgi:hypothetical protein